MSSFRLGALACLTILAADASHLRAAVDGNCTIKFPGSTPEQKCAAFAAHIDKENNVTVDKLKKPANATAVKAKKANGTSFIVPSYPGPEYEENYYTLDTCEEIFAELKTLKFRRDHCSQPRTYCWASVRINLDTWIQNIEKLSEHYKC